MTYKSFTNCAVKTVKFDNVPCLCLYWTSGIAAGSELRLDSLFDFFILFSSKLLNYCTKNSRDLKIF